MNVTLPQAGKYLKMVSSLSWLPRFMLALMIRDEQLIKPHLIQCATRYSPTRARRKTASLQGACAYSPHQRRAADLELEA